MNNNSLKKYKKLVKKFERKSIDIEKYKPLIESVLLYDEQNNTEFFNQPLLERFITYGVLKNWIPRLKWIRKNPYKSATKKSKYIRYGIAGIDKFKNYSERQAETNSFEYKNKKYGMTKDEYKEYNDSRAVTKNNLITRHGEEKGLSLWESYVDRQRYAGVKKEYFIEKYGKETGCDIYDKMIIKKSHTIDGVMSRDGCTYNEAVEWVTKRFSDSGVGLNFGYSKISQELFWEIYKNLSKEDRTHCYFAELNKEFGKFDHKNSCYRKYDFCLTNKKIIIEFNGDYYHANPATNLPSDIVSIHGNKKLVSDIWKNDEHKNNLIRNFGYNVIVVWQSSYDESKIETIIKIMGIINEENSKVF